MDQLLQRSLREVSEHTEAVDGFQEVCAGHLGQVGLQNLRHTL